MTYDPNQSQPPVSPVPPTGQAPAGGPVPVPPTGASQAPAGQPYVPTFIPPTVAAAAANPKPKGKVSGGTIAFVVAVVIAAAGLGFAGGRLTAPAATGRGNFPNGGNFPGASFDPNASGNPNRGGFGGFGGGSISLSGQVTAVANGSITVQTASGQSLTLQVPSTVTYHAQASAAPTDVTVGSQVQVSVNRGNLRPDASGQPAASGQPGAGASALTVTDITVLGK